MNARRRFALTGLLLLAVGAPLAWLAGGSTPAVAAAPRRFTASSQCQECHADVYAEWSASHHRLASTNPEVALLSDGFRKEECLDCHLPRPLAVTGFGNRTLPRRTNLDEGVGCIACHGDQDGGVLAAHARPDVPCQPRASAPFASADACASCHNQHQTTDQWRQSRYAKAGTDCASCHMPPVVRRRADGSERQGRAHAWLGAHDTPTLRTAGRFAAERRGDELVLALTNVGAGHNFPTEERHRAVDLVYRFARADGSLSDWTRAWRARQPYRDEPGDNTQLPVDQTKAVAVPIPKDAVRAQARLWYRLTPFCDDADPKSTLLEEREVTW